MKLRTSVGHERGQILVVVSAGPKTVSAHLWLELEDAKRLLVQLEKEIAEVSALVG